MYTEVLKRRKKELCCYNWKTAQGSLPKPHLGEGHIAYTGCINELGGIQG